MKKLLLILIALPMIGFGQDDEFTILQNKVEDMNQRMDRHHTEYFHGAIISGTGGLVMVAGIVASSTPIGIIGALIMTVGSVVSVKSHHWFKRNELYVEGNSDTVKVSDPIKKLLDLKDLLDLGLISREEFNKKAKELKQQIKD